MSEGSALANSDPPHQLLTFRALWRRTQTMFFYGAAVMLIGVVVTLFGNHKVDFEFLTLGVVLLVLALGFHFGSRRHYVQATAEGLLIHGLVSHQLIAFDDIRQVRTQQLQVIFSAPSRKGFLVRSLRQFEGTPACLVRLRLAPEQVAGMRKVVGRGCVIDQDLILLVAEAPSLERALEARLPRRRPVPAARRR